MVKQLKKTLRHLAPTSDVTYAELQSLLLKAASRINDRPIGVRRHSRGESEYLPITPNLMLLGSRSGTTDVELACVDED